MPTTTELKAQLSENWESWDTTGDGKLDTDDLLLAFDANNDGVLEKDELSNLVKQLQSQLEFNNVLLDQVNGLEEAQLAYQNEMREKQNALRQALVAGETARREADDLRRKMDHTQDQLDHSMQECRETREAAEASRSEAGARKRECQDLQRQVDNLEQEKLNAETRANALKEQLSKEREHNAEIEKGNMQRIHDLDKNHKAADRELELMKERQLPLETELYQMKQHIENLEDALEDTTAKFRKESEDKENLMKRTKDLENLTKALTEKTKQLNFAREAESGKARQLKSESAAQQAQMQRLEADLSARDRRSAELGQELKESQEENSALQAELDSVARELLSEAKQRAADQERWHQKLEEAQAHLQRTTTEWRATVQKLTEAKQSHAADTMRVRKEAEEKYIALQNEHTKLHKVLQETQAENKDLLSSSEAQRAEMEQQIRHLTDVIVQKDHDAEQHSNDTGNERSKLLAEIKSMKQEMSTRGQRYVKTLAIFQDAIKKLHTEGQTTKEAMHSVMIEYSAMKSYVHEVVEKQQQPLQLWFKEISGGLEALSYQANDLRVVNAEVRDNLRRTQLEREEERGRNALLEDTVADLEQEVKIGLARLKQSEDRAMEKQKAFQKDSVEMTTHKEELEDRIRRLEQNIHASNLQSQALQDDLQHARADLKTTQTRNSAKITALEKQISDLQHKNRGLKTERDQAHEQKNEKVNESTATEMKMQKLQGQVSKMQNEVQKQIAEREEEKKRFQQQLASLNESCVQSQRQATQTKSLLSVVQQQKQSLQADNDQLRSELTEMYKKNSLT